ncbi:MAG TPA: hypothetical protein VMU37_01650 [Caulobacteraceae bacterium]|nr:hypothetical protein [Caulobacteraceae bacterium]
MRASIVCVSAALSLSALTGVAVAQPRTASTASTPRVFLSPSGEPFRPTAAAPDPLKTWFDQVDTKHQGFIDREEFRADAVRFFKKLDENGDGIIDGFEVADYEHKLVPELAAEAEGRYAAGPAPRGGPSDQGGGGQGGPVGGRRRGQGTSQAQGHGQPASSSDGPSGRGRPMPQNPIQQLIGEPEPVTGADFNFDTHITLDEWMRATDQRFDILDEAKDGKLTLDELRARFKVLPKTP